MSADAAEPLDLAPIKARLANYASGPEDDLTGHMIARDLAHAVPSLVAEVERLRAVTTEVPNGSSHSAS